MKAGKIELHEFAGYGLEASILGLIIVDYVCPACRMHWLQPMERGDKPFRKTNESPRRPCPFCGEKNGHPDVKE